MNLGGIYESFDLNYLLALQLHLFKILILDNNILPGLILISLYDVFGLKRLAGYFILLFVCDRVMILFRKKIKADRLPCINGIVNPDRNGNERKLNVSFPDSAHKITVRLKS